MYSVRFIVQFQSTYNLLRIMSKRSKLNLQTQKTNPENLETTSKYFVAEILEPKKRKHVGKKRSLIEIKYEDTEGNKKLMKNEEKSIRNLRSARNVEKSPQNIGETSASMKKEKSLHTSDEIIQSSEKLIENQENTLGAKWTPANWEKTFELIKEMRKGQTAPVDDMGCHKCSDKDAEPKIYRFQSLLALMLSSQTKDQVTHAAMERLKLYGCTPRILLATPDDVLEKLIHPVSFYKRKVQYIKKTSEILLCDYNGDIPSTIEGLCALPGVGPKMGHICMQVAWDKVTGIGVDTHVHRICNRLNWVKKQAKTPEETRKQLEEWLPRKLWTEINYLLVGFGQEICLPQHPKCGECLNRKLCPFAKGAK